MNVLFDELKIEHFDLKLTAFEETEIEELGQGLDFGDEPDLDDKEKLPPKKLKLKTVECPECGEIIEIEN